MFDLLYRFINLNRDMFKNTQKHVSPLIISNRTIIVISSLIKIELAYMDVNLLSISFYMYYTRMQNVQKVFYE